MLQTIASTPITPVCWQLPWHTMCSFTVQPRGRQIGAYPGDAWAPAVRDPNSECIRNMLAAGSLALSCVDAHGGLLHPQDTRPQKEESPTQVRLARALNGSPLHQRRASMVTVWRWLGAGHCVTRHGRRRGPSLRSKLVQHLACSVRGAIRRIFDSDFYLHTGKHHSALVALWGVICAFSWLPHTRSCHQLVRNNSYCKTIHCSDGCEVTRPTLARRLAHGVTRASH